MVTVDGNQEQIRKLATYLRHNPGALTADPEMVARECGVDIDLVRRSFVQRRPAAAAPVLEEPSGPGVFERIRLKLRTYFNFFDRYLLWIVGGSVIFLELIFILMPEAKGMSWTDLIGIALIPVVALFHFLLYFRRGYVRYAFLGALVVWLVTTATVGISVIFGKREGDGLANFVMGAFGLMFMSLMYGGVGAASALMGAYRVVRHEDQAQRNRTRQDLIERMFQIEDLLGQQSVVIEDDSWLRRFLSFGRNNVWWLTLGTSVTVGLLSQLLTVIIDLPKGGELPSLPFVLAYLVVAGIQFVSHVVLSFFGGHPIRSLAVSVTYTLVLFGIGLLPFFNSARDLAKQNPGSAAVGYIFMSFLAIMIGIFAGIGAQVEERNYRRKRLSQNDPQLLLAELIEIQRVLNPDTSTQYLMVVDAARSSVMKANADPMQAEWSFREYQKFLARIVEANGGRIHSTAGDGAIAIFSSAASSFHAAREIQTKISDFNQNVNRLKDPFRLRIGIHCDTVQADLSDVQFAAVIDIAAHVEGASQIGGIAITQPVAEQLTEHRFAVLSDLVDGYVVSMALNPTLDPEDHV